MLLLLKVPHLSVTLPLHELIPKLTRPELTSIARVHGVGMYSRLSVSEAKELMLSHICDCPEIVSIMSIVAVVPREPRPLKNKNKIAQKNAKAYLRRKQPTAPPSDAYSLKLNTKIFDQAKRLRFIRKVCQRRLRGTNFPPRPAPEEAVHRIITQSSRSVQPDRFLEASCAVCGQLCLPN